MKHSRYGFTASLLFSLMALTLVLVWPANATPKRANETDTEPPSAPKSALRLTQLG
jgi:hypothetical protein